MKRLRSLVLALCLLATACAQTAADTPPPESAGQEPVVLNFFTWEDERVSITAVADAYMAQNPHVEIQFTIVPSTEFTQRLSTLMSQGAQIDGIFFSTVQGASVQYSKGVLAVLDVDERIQRQLAPGYGDILEYIDQPDGVYILPYRTSEWAVFYNKQLFDAAGLSYPTSDWTWGEYASTAVALTSGSGEERVYGSLSFEPTSRWWRVPARTAGAEDPLVDEHFDIFMENLQWIYELTYELEAQPPYTERTGISGADYDSAFLQGNVAMYFTGDWSIEKLNRGIERDGLDFEYDIAELPYWEGHEAHALGAPAVVGMTTTTEHPDEVLDFLFYTCGEEGAGVFASLSIIPTYRTAEIIETFNQSCEMPSSMGYFFTDRPKTFSAATPAFEKSLALMQEQVNLFLLQEQDYEKTYGNIQNGLRELADEE